MGLTAAKLKNRLTRLCVRGRDLPPVARDNLSALDGLDPKAPCHEHSFAVVDLETTGMDPARDRVISVGAVRVRRGRVIPGDYFAEMVNPRREIPARSIRIHGITPDQVAGARRVREVFPDFLAWLGGDILVAHYARFDLHFINLTMKSLYGFALQNLVLDTLGICSKVVLPSDPYGVLDQKGRCTLDALCQRYGIGAQERHTALGDALATALIFQRMLAKLEANGQPGLAHLIRAGRP